jgi:hypothetical protein
MADEPREITKEITFLPWVAKIVERLTCVQLCIREKQDKIQESDYEVLEALHGLWHNGHVPFYQTIKIEDKTKVTQGGLFDIPVEVKELTEVTIPDKGIEIDSPKTETKKKKKK